MMKFVNTLQNSNGTYDECGMNNRRLYNSERAALKAARELSAGTGRTVRVQGWPYSEFYKSDSKPRIERYVNS